MNTWIQSVVATKASLKRFCDNPKAFLQEGPYGETDGRKLNPMLKRAEAVSRQDAYIVMDGMVFILNIRGSCRSGKVKYCPVRLNPKAVDNGFFDKMIRGVQF